MRIIMLFHALTFALFPNEQNLETHLKENLKRIKKKPRRVSKKNSKHFQKHLEETSKMSQNNIRRPSKKSRIILNKYQHNV